MTETICVPKREYLQLVEEVKTLRKTNLYKRLLEAEQNISQGMKFTRKDLGF